MAASDESICLTFFAIAIAIAIAILLRVEKENIHKEDANLAQMAQHKRRTKGHKNRAPKFKFQFSAHQ